MKSKEIMQNDLNYYDFKLTSEKNSLQTAYQEQKQKLRQKILSVEEQLKQIELNRNKHLDQIEELVVRKISAKQLKITQLKQQVDNENSQKNENSMILQGKISNLSLQVNQFNEAKSLLQDKTQWLLEEIEQMLKNFSEKQLEEHLNKVLNYTVDENDFSSIITITKNSNQLKVWSPVEKRFQQKQVNILETEGNFTQIEQFQDEKLAISGGSNKNQNRLTIYSQFKLQDFEMIKSRYYHRTRYDKKDNIYVISGITKVKTNVVEIDQCEVFQISQQKSKEIGEIKLKAYGFGCDIFENQVYVFGGFDSSVRNSLNAIQTYDSARNEWTVQSNTLSTSSCASAAFINDRNVFLLYRNNSDLPTQLYDMNSITIRGDRYNGVQMQEYIQPISSSNFVYQFDNGSNLLIYNMNTERWDKAK